LFQELFVKVSYVRISQIEKVKKEELNESLFEMR